MIRWIGLEDSDSLGIVTEQEFFSTNEALISALYTKGYIKPYDDIKPLPPKGLNIHENKIYPSGRLIANNGNLYQSKPDMDTSATFIEAEWNMIIEGM